MWKQKSIAWNKRSEITFVWIFECVHFCYRCCFEKMINEWCTYRYRTQWHKYAEIECWTLIEIWFDGIWKRFVLAYFSYFFVLRELWGFFFPCQLALGLEWAWCSMTENMIKYHILVHFFNCFFFRCCFAFRLVLLILMINMYIVHAIAK